MDPGANVVSDEIQIVPCLLSTFKNPAPIKKAVSKYVRGLGSREKVVYSISVPINFIKFMVDIVFRMKFSEIPNLMCLNDLKMSSERDLAH